MIQIIGCAKNADVFKHIKKIPAMTRRGISKAFLDIGPAIIKEASNDMKKTKSGRTYRVYFSKKGRRLKKGRLHRASSRGESPAILSGTLLRSLGFNRKTFTSLTIGASAEHAQWLEPSLNGEWSGYLDRPFMLRSIEATEKETENYFRQYMMNELLR